MRATQLIIAAVSLVTAAAWSAKASADGMRWRQSQNETSSLQNAEDSATLPDKNSIAQKEFNKRISEKLQIFADRPSFDTTPVIVRVQNVSYRIPRNYLSYLAIPTIKVTYPAMEPLSDKNKDCFSVHPPAQCVVFEFGIHSPFVSHQVILERKMSLFRSKTPRAGPFGYQVYETGPEEARVETYVKPSKPDFVLLNCMIFFYKNVKNAVCPDNFPLLDGNTIHFFASFSRISEVPNIELSVRNLIESFRIKE